MTAQTVPGIPNVILQGAILLFQQDINLAPQYRSMETPEFRELHDELVRLGQIDPEPDDTWEEDEQ